MLPWLLCGLLLAIILALWVKVRLLQKTMDQIKDGLEERLQEDTNTLISISSGDRHARRLTARLNVQLRELRAQRRTYQAGDKELKEAVTNISHDLRTPLTALSGYLDLLKEESLTPDGRRYVAQISDRTQTMRQLTEELFRYSVATSTEELHLEPVSLSGAVAESLAAFYGALTEAGVTPAVDLPEEPVIRTLDRRALARILGNLLTNAIKYSDGDLDVRLTPEGELTFANTAPGLDEVEVGRLFDRFFSVETARNSTGLGLSIARALAERMGGTISADYGEGRLTIRLGFPKEQNDNRT